LDFWNKLRPYLYAALAMLIIAAVFMFVFFLWLSSRLQVLLIKALQEGTIEIRSLWDETARAGQALFSFNLKLYVSVFVFLAVFGGLSGGVVYWAIKQHSTALGVSSGLLFFLVMVLF